jgi:hypothetical protein
MKRIESPGAVFRYDGELVRVVGIGDGRSIKFESLEKPPCPCCHRSFRFDLLERSSLFQDRTEPVETLSGGGG